MFLELGYLLLKKEKEKIAKIPPDFASPENRPNANARNLSQTHEEGSLANA